MVEVDVWFNYIIGLTILIYFQRNITIIILTRQVTRATHVRKRVCPRVELILKIIIILLIIFLGFIKSKPCSQTIKVKKILFPAWGLNSDPCTPQLLTS